MKNITFLILVCLLTSCNKTYIYKYTLDGSKNLSYKDQSIAVQFAPNHKYFEFFIENKSTTPIKIVWDESVLVINEIVSRLMHENIRYSDRMSSAVPTFIPPGEKLYDLVAPTDFVTYSAVTSSSAWVQNSIYPDHGLKSIILPMVKASVGKHVKLYLMVEGGDGSKKLNVFDFKIEGYGKKTYKNFYQGL